MTRKKRIVIISAIAIVAVLLATAIVFAGLGIANAVKMQPKEPLAYNGPRQNVILMIGDGMGPNHLLAAEGKFGEMFMTSAPVKGHAVTDSRNLFGPTDSAASATALSTGYKVYNGNVGWYRGEDLLSTTEIAQSLQMSTAVLATEGVDGATPAGFSAHTSSRNNLDEILADQLAGKVDVFLGSNRARYTQKQDEIRAAGFTYLESLPETLPANERIFGSFDEVFLQDSPTTPTLARMSTLTIEKLRANPNGFFMMIEESHIDKCSHDNRLNDALDHVLAYDRTIQAVVELAEQIGNTVVIVTADHETGGLQYDSRPVSAYSDDMYTVGHHTEADVPYFIFGDLHGLQVPAVIDNTQIAMLCQSILQAKQSL